MKNIKKILLSNLFEKYLEGKYSDIEFLDLLTTILNDKRK